MKSESNQKITALTEADEKQLQDQRAVIEKFLPGSVSVSGNRVYQAVEMVNAAKRQ